jgi:hypothetical protein
MQKLTLAIPLALLMAGLSFPPGQAQAQRPTVDISGTWSGTAVNNDGRTATASLIVKENVDGTLTGKWGPLGKETPIEKGERVTTDVLHWEAWYADETTPKTNYRIVCTVMGKALVVHWAGTRKHDGKVKGETGMVVLVRQ